MRYRPVCYPDFPLFDQVFHTAGRKARAEGLDDFGFGRPVVIIGLRCHAEMIARYSRNRKPLRDSALDGWPQSEVRWHTCRRHTPANQSTAHLTQIAKPARNGDATRRWRFGYITIWPATDSPRRGVGAIQIWCPGTRVPKNKTRWTAHALRGPAVHRVRYAPDTK